MHDGLLGFFSTAPFFGTLHILGNAYGLPDPSTSFSSLSLHSKTERGLQSSGTQHFAIGIEKWCFAKMAVWVEGMFFKDRFYI